MPLEFFGLLAFVILEVAKILARATAALLERSKICLPEKALAMPMAVSFERRYGEM